MDGRKSPLIKPGRAWRSEDNAAAQHFVQIDLSRPTLLTEITLWVAFRTTGPDRDDDGEAGPAPGRAS